MIFRATELILCNCRNSNSKICARDVSKAAVKEFMKNRYPRYDTCDKPCTKMDIQTSLVSKSAIPIRSDTTQLTFMFGKTVSVSSEVLPRSSFNLVAEVGGYLGLTLGLSLMHLELPIKILWQKIVVWRTKDQRSGH